LKSLKHWDRKEREPANQLYQLDELAFINQRCYCIVLVQIKTSLPQGTGGDIDQSLIKTLITYQAIKLLAQTQTTGQEEDKKAWMLKK
jgi:hypothetical protein